VTQVGGPYGLSDPHFRLSCKALVLCGYNQSITPLTLLLSLLLLLLSLLLFIGRKCVVSLLRQVISDKHIQIYALAVL
jgi:hypothetical protein